MKKETIEGKKIRLVQNKHNIFLTIKKVIEITDTHIIFLDKFNKQKGIRISDIVEIFEVKP